MSQCVNEINLLWQSQKVTTDRSFPTCIESVKQFKSLDVLKWEWTCHKSEAGQKFVFYDTLESMDITQ